VVCRLSRHRSEFGWGWWLRLGLWRARCRTDSSYYFGTSQWPTDVAVPQAWLEFDVEDIEAATRELEERGFRLLVQNRTGVTRLLSPEGLLVASPSRPGCVARSRNADRFTLRRPGFIETRVTESQPTRPDTTDTRWRDGAFTRPPARWRNRSQEFVGPHAWCADRWR